MKVIKLDLRWGKNIVARVAAKSQPEQGEANIKIMAPMPSRKRFVYVIRLLTITPVQFRSLRLKTKFIQRLVAGRF
jgi:hypothetical protein